MNYKTRKIAMLGVLAALAYLSVVLINIPVVSVDFLKYLSLIHISLIDSSKRC